MERGKPIGLLTAKSFLQFVRCPVLIKFDFFNSVKSISEKLPIVPLTILLLGEHAIAPSLQPDASGHCIFAFGQVPSIIPEKELFCKLDERNEIDG